MEDVVVPALALLEGALAIGFFLSLTPAVVLEVFFLAGPACFAAFVLPFSTVLSTLALRLAALAFNCVEVIGAIATACGGGVACICDCCGAICLLSERSLGLITPDILGSYSLYATCSPRDASLLEGVGKLSLLLVEPKDPGPDICSGSAEYAELS